MLAWARRRCDAKVHDKLNQMTTYLGRRAERCLRCKTGLTGPKPHRRGSARDCVLLSVWGWKKLLRHLPRGAHPTLVAPQSPAPGVHHSLSARRETRKAMLHGISCLEFRQSLCVLLMRRQLRPLPVQTPQGRKWDLSFVIGMCEKAHMMTSIRIGFGKVGPRLGSP